MAYVIMNNSQINHVIILHSDPTEEETKKLLKLFGGTHILKTTCDAANDPEEIFEAYQNIDIYPGCSQPLTH